MAGLADLAQSLILTVGKDLASDFMAPVTWTPWTGATGDGDDTFGSPQGMSCLVDKSVKQYYTGDGRLVQVSATLTFLDTFPVVTATGRKNPVDPRDVFTLDDGSTAPIVDLPQFENPATGQPFFVQVMVGRVVGG